MSGGCAKREREAHDDSAEDRESKRAHVVVPGVETDAPVVCAIDFGTACTGVAFAFTSKPGNNLSTACLFDMHFVTLNTCCDFGMYQRSSRCWSLEDKIRVKHSRLCFLIRMANSWRLAQRRVKNTTMQ